MIQSENFDFNEIEKNLKKSDKIIDFKSKNMKIIKNLSFGFIYVALFFFAILFFGGLIAIIVDIPQIDNIVMQILKLFLGLLFISLVMGIIFMKFSFKGKVNLQIYHKLKKISKRDYEVYKYTANIGAFYNSTSVEYRSNSSKDIDSDVTFQKRYIKSNGNILLVDDQKIYVDNLVYDEIKYDKQINLYFAKYENEYILFDFERVMENK